MLNPAGSLRKSKPDLICRASRLAATLCASRSASADQKQGDDALQQPVAPQPRPPAGAPGGVGADLQRSGGAYIRPPLVQRLLTPRGSADRRLRAEVALEAFAVVADLLDDPVGPCGIEAEELAGVLRDAEEALDARILVARLLLVDVRLRQAVLLGFDHREQRPADDLEPFVVAASHRRAERLLRDHLRQDQVVVGLGRFRARSGEVAHVGRVDLAPAGEEGARDRFGGVEHDRLVLHPVRAEVVGDVLLARRAGLHAHGRSIQLLRAVDLQLRRNHEALAVEVVDAREHDAEGSIPRQGPGAVA